MEKYKRLFNEGRGKDDYDFDMTLTDKTAIRKFLAVEMDADLHGYSFSYFEDGLYTFSKKEDDYNNSNYGKSISIVVSQEQLFNGDIDFMTQNDMSLDSNRQRKEKQKFKNFR